VIQYFADRVVGELMINSFVFLSNVAVVCISTALLPYPNSVRQKHPIDLNSSISSKNLP
jgi:hypothetical protein